MGEGPPVATEQEIGITSFLTRASGVGGRIKARVEDFRVDELGSPPERVTAGPFAAARIRLTNWETNRFVREASRRLRTSRTGIAFSGTKDKRAVTTQWFTFRARPDELGPVSRLQDVEVLEAFPTPRPLELGDHAGNAFDVTVRGIRLGRGEALARARAVAAEVEAAGGFPNFFGPQRFGSLRSTTHRVGRAIVRGDFEAAVDAYLTGTVDGEDELVARAREVFAHGRDPKATLEALGDAEADFERPLLHALVERPGDCLSALESLPWNLQLLFVHAYQSLLFNRILSRRIESGAPVSGPLSGDLVAPRVDGNLVEEWMPVDSANLERVAAECHRGRLVPTGLLAGTEAPFAQGAMGSIEREVLAEEDLEPRSFVVPESTRLTSKGTRRALAVARPRIGIEAGDDELDGGSSKLRLRFELPKGAYATVLLREFLKEDAL